MKKIIIISALFTIALLANTVSFAQNNGVLGKWVTIDDETGKKKSVVEIYERNGKVYGKIIKLYRGPDEEQDPVCDECDKDDPRYLKKIIGMEIMTDMVKDGDEYTDGKILKPDEGDVYTCTIWREGKNLKVRGYILFLYRTQTWIPYTGD